MRKRRNKLNTQYIISLLIFGIILISVLAGLVLTTTSNSADPDDLADLPTPAPTTVVFPTVEPGGPNLTLNPPVVNSQGYFQVAAPSDFEVQRNLFNPSLPRANVTFLSPVDKRLAVIDVLMDFGINFPSHQALSDDYLTADFFLNAWSEYDSATELNRSVGDSVIINFDLVSETRHYLGRQVSWLDQDWLHTVRIIVPNNNPALLDALEAMVVPTFIGYDDQRDAPMAWVAAVDPNLKFLIRHPNWQSVSRSLIRSQVLPAEIVMRTASETPLTSLDEAEAYVSETLRGGSETLSVQVTTREFGSGYLVSFSDRDREGNPISGLVALLNDAENNLHIAELRLNEPNIDLLALESGSPYAELRNVIDTFMVLPPADYVITPAANPLVTEEPAVETEEAAGTEESLELPVEDRPTPQETAEAVATEEQ